MQKPKDQHERTETALTRLKPAYDEGMASGEGECVDREAFLRELKIVRRGRD